MKKILVPVIFIAGLAANCAKNPPPSAETIWEQIIFPSKKPISTIAISGNNIFAGTWGDGIFLSNDSGTSWTAVNSGLEDYTIWALAVSGSDILAGTNGCGVFISHNNGSTWIPVNSGLANLSVYSLALRGSTIIAGTAEGIFLSADNGSSWTPTGSFEFSVSSLAVVDSNMFAAVSAIGLYSSSDNGATWKSAEVVPFCGWPTSLIECNGTMICGMFSLDHSSDCYGGIMRSADSFAIWTEVPINSGSYDLAASGSIAFAGMSDGLYCSSDCGATWPATASSFADINVVSLAIIGDYLYAATADRYLNSWFLLREMTAVGTLWRSKISDVVDGNGP